MNRYDIIIIGAGASGLMCASFLRRSLNVLFIDANPKIAQKIKISGGGKCNITNLHVNSKNYVGDEKFISQTLKEFDNKALVAYLQKQNLPLVLRKKQFYFCKNSSQEIIDILKKNTSWCKFALSHKVKTVIKNENGFLIQTDKAKFQSDKVIVASGGASFPSLGASDIALKIASDLDISYTSFKPALVGLTVQKEQFWMKNLSGISIDVAIKVEDKTIKGSLLFAHKGISGPSVLNSSLYWKKGLIEVDFLPYENLFSLLKKGGKKQLSSVLPLPKRFVKEFLAHLHLEDKSVSKLTQEEKETLTLIHRYRFAPAGNFGFSKAEVSLGGVDIKELQDDFEVRKIPSLYFIGEAVDVVGELGGYNFQWAFSSGVKCARSISQNLK
ncbi:MAG: aminoacetone oxidase family FAD-binding enzyme [Epsilonproteobacteria bacterium]|nr:aminoacetone oxidase family FAD-binding enzyme [Campylobacterota bacterium]